MKVTKIEIKFNNLIFSKQVKSIHKITWPSNMMSKRHIYLFLVPYCKLLILNNSGSAEIFKRCNQKK